VLNVLLALLFSVAQEPAGSGAALHGVTAKFTQGEASDLAVLPNLALFVARTNPPSAFLKPGRFTAEFSGFVSVELRAQYTFRVVANGQLELLVNGNSVLTFVGNGQSSEPSKPVRLNRGTNSILARFTAPESGDAQFQVLWTPKNSAVAIPIPMEVLSYNESAEVKNSAELHRGFYLFAEYRCGRCHGSGEQMASELDFGAPDFESIGSRLNSTWMADWVVNPTMHMPKLFSDAEPGNRIAAYLSTLKGPAPKPVISGDSAKGKELFQTLQCAVCHVENDAGLLNVRRKFAPGALVEYLENPQAHYRWTPMPNFKLSDPEAGNLGGFLLERGQSGEEPKGTGGIEEGRMLIQVSGCLNCHASKLENQYSAPALAAISRSGLSGCLSTNGTKKAPQFNLEPEGREALAAFLRNGNFTPLLKSVPQELALRQSETLRCAECHEKVEGAPRFATLGAKLKPKWAKRFIAGEVQYKPRPWMQPQMPAFPAHAAPLAVGLAALHGHSAESSREQNLDAQMAGTGAKLISAAGGFSCVACHAVGAFTSGQVVETPGVNLAQSGERLLKSYFDRWVMNPVLLEPNTKMPVYFDAQGRSQLTDILEGDAEKQINAIWEYVRLGDKMPPPPIPQP
jgi:mono/diheme cytochrome c family protein